MLKSDQLKLERADFLKRMADDPGLRNSANTNKIKVLDNAIERAEKAEAGERDQLSRDAPLTGEDLEKQALLERASVSDFLKALIEHQPVKGASAEARAAFGCVGEHEVPLELFTPKGTKAVTPAPGTVDIDVRPVQPFVYQRSVAGFLGIDMPNVGSGIPAYPVLTTNTPAGMKGKGEAADSTAAAVTVSKGNCKRITGAYQLRVEDLAVFPQIEPALRRDLPMSLRNTLDDQILNGNGTAPNLKSIFSQLTDPTADTTTEDFGRFVSTVSGKVDGTYAYGLSDLYLLCGLQTHELMRGTFATGTAVSSADYLTDKLGGLRVSGKIPAPQSDDQQAILRRGMVPMSAVMPVWGGINLIADPYSDSTKGMTTVTAYQLVSDVLILRGDAWLQIDFHVG